MLHFITGGKILKGDENGREGGVEGAGGESVGEEGGAMDLPGGVGDGVAAKRISNERNTRLRLVFRNSIWDMGAWWRKPVGKVQDIMIMPGGMG